MTEPIRLAVLGDPLAYTRSPILHRAGLEFLGRAGTSEALRTPPTVLGERLDALSAAGYRGVNLTHPLKYAVFAHLGRITDRAREARSVNTVVMGAETRLGDTTDGEGFLDWLRVLGREPARERVMLLGAGGAARSLALALSGAGARVSVAARRPAEDGTREDVHRRARPRAQRVLRALPPRVDVRQVRGESNPAIRPPAV